MKGSAFISKTTIGRTTKTRKEGEKQGNSISILLLERMEKLTAQERRQYFVDGVSKLTVDDSVDIGSLSMKLGCSRLPAFVSLGEASVLASEHISVLPRSASVATNKERLSLFVQAYREIRRTEKGCLTTEEYNQIRNYWLTRVIAAGHVHFPSLRDIDKMIMAASVYLVDNNEDLREKA